MDVLSVEKIRLLELKARQIGLQERILIENASSNLFYVIDELPLGRRVLVVAGRGNNGADVLSCARKLHSRGYDVKVAVLEDKLLGEEALFQKNLLERIKVSVHTVKTGNVQQFKEFLKEKDFVLEGILGIGIKGEVAPFFKEVISLINDSGKKIVSCDIPSGLDPDKGIVLGKAINADYTVTFLGLKQGFLLNQGPGHCGKIFIADIGISREILEEGT